jgi:hypothetical protein
VVGDGECCTLASEALAAAGANPSTGYVFGAAGAAGVGGGGGRRPYKRERVGEMALRLPP